MGESEGGEGGGVEAGKGGGERVCGRKVRQHSHCVVPGKDVRVYKATACAKR